MVAVVGSFPPDWVRVLGAVLDSPSPPWFAIRLPLARSLLGGVSGDLGVTVPALSGAAPGFSGPGGRWARPRPSAGFADSRPNQAPIRPKPGADSRLNQALIRAQTWRGFAP